MTLFQEGNTVGNNKLIFPVALKTIINQIQQIQFQTINSVAGMMLNKWKLASQWEN